jgi:hypothetical protein
VSLQRIVAQSVDRIIRRNSVGVAAGCYLVRWDRAKQQPLRLNAKED